MKRWTAGYVDGCWDVCKVWRQKWRKIELVEGTEKLRRVKVRWKEV